MHLDPSAPVAPPTRQPASTRGAAIAAALAVLFGIATPAAHARPVDGRCRVTTYYADAGMTTQVGTYSTCPGSRGLTGRRTAFFEVDEIQIGPGPRPKPPGQNPFPRDLQ